MTRTRFQYTDDVNNVCIITALAAESRVFIDALRLRPVQDYGWRLYSHENVLLLQTGVGKLKAAAATASVLHTCPDITAIINAGVAGGKKPIGTCLQAHRIYDAGSGHSWYPHLPPQRVTPDISGTEVLTLDKPASDYSMETVFDMEAAGIVSAATPYLSTDAIQCIKVISDNPESPWESFNKTQATECMQSTVAPVLSLIDWYAQREDPRTRQNQVRTLCDAIVLQMHFTSTEEHQLKRLLHRHQSLTGNLPDMRALQQLNSAKAVRQYLEAKLSDTQLEYSV